MNIINELKKISARRTLRYIRNCKILPCEQAIDTQERCVSVTTTYEDGYVEQFIFSGDLEHGLIEVLTIDDNHLCWECEGGWNVENGEICWA